MNDGVIDSGAIFVSDELVEDRCNCQGCENNKCKGSLKTVADSKTQVYEICYQ